MTKLNQRLARCSMGSGSHVQVVVRNGTVTLSGELDFDYQRKPLLRAANGVNGVRMVVDQLRVKPPRHWTSKKSQQAEQV